MGYDAILVDVFNAYHRKKSDIDIFVSANNTIKFIKEIQGHLNEGGDLYLLFDPIPKDDLGVSKTFARSVRQEIVPDYKANRIKDPKDLESLRLVQNYFKFRGEHIKSVFNSYCEADDFVEPLVTGVLKGKKVAMVSTDYDWARFISDDCDFINEWFDKPFTKEDFKNKFGSYPTVLYLTLYKAIFGDASDNIIALNSIKKIFYYIDLKTAATNMLKSLPPDMTVADFEKKFFYTKHDISLESVTECKDPMEVFFFTLWFAKETKVKIRAARQKVTPLEIFQDNIRIIKTRAPKNINKCIRCFEENKSFNKTIESTLGIISSNNSKEREIKFKVLKVI